MSRMSRPRGRNLVLLSTFALGLAALAFLTGCSPEVQAELTTYDGINAIRAKHGMPPLTPDKQLVDVARVRSQDMAAKTYFGHNPPDGCNFVCIMDNKSVGHSWGGENIAWNNYPWAETADRAVVMWENSPPHLKNILDCHFTRMGSGVAVASDGKIYYTMIFEGNAPC